MTLGQLVMEMTNRKISSERARELADTPKFRAGLKREKKRLAKLREKFTGKKAAPTP